MSDLKQSTKRAIAWSAVDKISQHGVALLCGIALMQWLDQADFGKMASLALYSTLAGVLCDGGLSAALIRKTDATDRDYHTVFWVNAVLGSLFYGVLWLAAPWIADFNEAPELVAIGRTLFLAIFFNALGIIQLTQLIKRSDFRRLGIANVVSVAFGAAVAVVVALGGYGVWALVFQVVGVAACRSVALWMLARWRPRWTFDREAFQRMFGFSSKLLLGNLAAAFSTSYYLSALGQHFSQVQKGYYERANKIKETGSGSLMHVFGQSLYLMLAHLQDDPGRFLQAFRKSVRTVSFLLFPAMLGLGLVARPLLGLFPDGKWLPAVPLLQLFCFSGILAMFYYVCANAVKVRGRSDITLTFDLLNAALLVGLLFGAIRHGLQAVILADILTRSILMLGYVFCMRRLFGYGLWQQLRDVAPYAGLAAAMCALVWPLKFVIGNDLLLLTAQVILGAGFYLGANRMLGSKVLEEVVGMVRKR